MPNWHTPTPFVYTTGVSFCLQMLEGFAHQLLRGQMETEVHELLDTLTMEVTSPPPSPNTLP